MNRRDAETRRENQLSDAIIGCAIEVHRHLTYKGIKLDCGYVIDLVVDELVIVELKTVEKLLPVHEAQLITYLKLYGCKLGLLLNFNVAVLRSGIRRLVNEF